MSLLTVKESPAASIVNPPVGKVVLFVDSANGKFSKKNSSGVVEVVGADGANVFAAYPTSHSTSGGDTSIFTLDLAGRPTPAIGEEIHIKLGNTNQYGIIEINIPTVGSFILQKTAGSGFIDNEFTAGQFLSVIVDGSNAFIIGGIIQTKIVQLPDAAALKTLMTGNSLQVGTWYEFVHTTQYTLDGAIVASSTPETLYVRAISPNKIHSQAQSFQYPADIIEYDLFNLTFGEKIVRRVDPIKRLDTPYDWRNVKFRRGRNSALNLYVISDPAATEFSSDFQDIYTFDNSSNGGDCRSITIHSIAVNPASTGIADLLNWNLIDGNNTFHKISNAEVKGNSYFNSLYNQLDGTPANNPALNNGVSLNNTRHSQIGNASNSDINNSERLGIAGSLGAAGDLKFTASKLVIKNCLDVYVGENSIGLELIGVTNGWFRESSNIKVNNSENVWVTDSSKITVLGCDDSAFMFATSSVYANTSHFTAFDASKENINASRNIITYAVNNTNVENLKDVYDVPTKSCDVVASIVNPTSVILTAFLSVATFVDGDILKVDNTSLAVAVDRPALIAFDTTGNDVADTATIPVKIAGFQKFYPAALPTTFYMLYRQNAFHIIMNNVYNPIKIDTSDTLFDGLRSNIVATAQYSGGSLFLNDPTNYDYSHAGYVNISHAGTDIINDIQHDSGKYPRLQRRLVNGNLAADITLSHGIGANLIACPAAVSLVLTGDLEFADIEKNGSQWMVTNTQSY